MPRLGAGHRRPPGWPLDRVCTESARRTAGAHDGGCAPKPPERGPGPIRRCLGASVMMGLRSTACAPAAGLLAAALLLVSAPALAGPGDTQGGKGVVFAKRRDCVKAVPLLEEAEKLRHRPLYA